MTLLPPSLSPPPFRTPLLNKTGEMTEEWRRFHLATQTSITALLQFTQRIGSGTGMLGLEDVGGDDFSLAMLPGPPGPPGTIGASGMPSFASVDADQGEPFALSPPGGVSVLGGPFTPGAVIFAGTNGNLSQDSTNFFWDDSNKNLKFLAGTYIYWGDTNSSIIYANNPSWDPFAGNVLTFNTFGGTVDFRDTNAGNIPIKFVSGNGILMLKGRGIYWSDLNDMIRNDDNPSWFTGKGSVLTFNNYADSGQGVAVWRDTNTSTIRMTLDYKNGGIGLGLANNTLPTSMADILCAASTRKGVIVQGAASQSADLQEWQNSSAAVLATIDASGRLGIGTTSVDPLGINALIRLLGSSGNSAALQIEGNTADADATRECDLAFAAAANTTSTRIVAFSINTDGSTATNRGGRVAFSTKADGGGLAEQLRIDQAGLSWAKTAFACGATPATAGTLRGTYGGPFIMRSRLNDANITLLGMGSVADDDYIEVGDNSQHAVTKPLGIKLYPGSAVKLQLDTNGNLTLKSTVIQYNGINTAGWGVPAINGSGRATAQAGAVASVAAYTVGAADGSFWVSMNILVTAFTAGTISGVVTYTDEGNTARSLTMNFSSVGGVLSTTPGAAGAFEGVPLHIRAKASTAITCTTTVSLFTGTYNVDGAIAQIA